jgi:hypothetical protein
MEGHATLFLGEAWFDPIEAGIREQIRGFIEGLIKQELTAVLGRRRYRRDEICFGGIGRGDAIGGDGSMTNAGGLPAWLPRAPALRRVRDGRDRCAAGADRRCGRHGSSRRARCCPDTPG